MIISVQGNLLDYPFDALVNAVNTDGIMGGGIALMFRNRFEKNYIEYEQACKRREVRVGKMFVTEIFTFGTLTTEGRMRYIINFPTKNHYYNPSKIEWIKEGLVDLRRVIAAKNIKSIAIPQLGCGLGGLKWFNVKPLIVGALQNLDITVHLYEPII